MYFFSSFDFWHFEYLSWILTGLKCYNQENGQPATVINCDDFGGANYCAKVNAPQGIAKSCGMELVMDALRPLGLTSAGCMSMSGYTFCLCTENKCNWKNPDIGTK